LNGIIRQSAGTGKAFAETVVAVEGERAVGQAVKGFFAVDERGFAGGARAYLMAVSTHSAPELVKNTMSSWLGMRFFNSARQQAGEQRRLHFHQARIIGVEEFLEDGLTSGWLRPRPNTP
jgi:hypothetical protein